MNGKKGLAAILMCLALTVGMISTTGVAEADAAQ